MPILVGGCLVATPSRLRASTQDAATLFRRSCRRTNNTDVANTHRALTMAQIYARCDYEVCASILLISIVYTER